MSKRDDIDQFMAGRRKPSDYDGFADELARYAEMMADARPSTRNADLDPVRDAVRHLSKELQKLPYEQQTCWWPDPDTDGRQRAWVDAAIRAGQRLTDNATVGGARRTQEIAYALEHAAHIWEKYYGKRPGLGTSSPFLPLFRKLLPFNVSRETAKKVLAKKG